MKTKRIVALALTAAMAVSMASTTAFAANKLWEEYEVNADDDKLIASNSTELAKVIKVKDDDNEAEYYEGFVVKYKVQKTDGTIKTVFNDVRNYTFRKGSTVSQKTTNGKTTTLYLLNGDDNTQTGKEESGILWKNFKSKAQDLGAPSTKDEDNWVFLGWTLDPTLAGNTTGTEPNATNNWQASNTASNATGILQDTDEMISIATAKNGGKDGTATGGALEIFPVFREKTSAEKLQSQVNIANRPKVAKPAGSKDGWVYTQNDLDNNTAKVSQPLAEDASSDALKKCNAEMKHSRVYEIKPQVGTDIVELKKGATQEVVIPIKTLYAAVDVATDKDVNDLIKKGKLKVFHIGSDGKSRQVTGIKGAGDGTGAVKFKCGSFSEFVITKDPNARAQAGEEDGASGGNPATGEASTLPVAMLALAALSATGVVAYKKRKAE